jgi:mannose/fructose/N-acetylgalactosamine-specific phosphotransferase system component IIC
LTLLALACLGAVVALDATSFGQLMLSRPLVAGTLAGAIVGMPLEGALIGAFLEAVSLGILPVGAAKYPETGTAAVAAAGTLGLSAAAPLPGTLLLVLMYGVILQRVFGATVIAGRYLNERLVHAGEIEVRANADRAIERRHLTSMLVDVLRGAIATALALLVGVPLLRLAVTYSALPSQVAALAVAAAAAALLAGPARMFSESRRIVYFLLLGALCGSALLFVR